MKVEIKTPVSMDSHPAFFVFRLTDFVCIWFIGKRAKRDGGDWRRVQGSAIDGVSKHQMRGPDDQKANDLGQNNAGGQGKSVESEWSSKNW
jgi:hypothetical protein